MYLLIDFAFVLLRCCAVCVCVVSLYCVCCDVCVSVVPCLSPWLYCVPVWVCAPFVLRASVFLFCSVVRHVVLVLFFCLFV